VSYRGSCHCGRVRFEVRGEFDTAMECNCSHCSRKGYLLWFVPRPDFALESPADALSTYTFNKHAIRHHFCPTVAVHRSASVRPRAWKWRRSMSDASRE
jgi:hypothetical protein